VFEDSTWVFHRHEQWAVTGPNGGGKSLLADALRGCLPLVGGELRYHFRPPPGLLPEQAIGHVSFEDRKLELHDTVVQSRWNSLEEEGALAVRDFLAYERVMEINPFEVNRAHERTRASFERRRRRAVAVFQAAPLLDRTLISLSNGERQRVQLTRAFCQPLRLLILDEPFTGLDAATRRHLHALLERLMGTPLRVLLVTARPEDLPRHVSHLLWVDRCRVVAAGPRRQVLACLDPGASRSRASSRLRLPPKSKGWCWRQAAPPQRELELVRLRDVTVRYGQSVLLRDVNWTIRAGQSWALLGPNGSGKTTLLSLLLGDNPQTYSNSVVMFGRARAAGESIWDLKRRIGWLSPELQLFFDDSLVCLDVVASGFKETVGLFEPVTARQRTAARRWLHQFGLLAEAQTTFFALSAGQQRLVLLARALVKGPELLILDEPCQGLDAAHRALLIRTVDGLIRRGAVTVVYVTHRLDEIPPFIKRVLRLARQQATTGRLR